MIGLLDAFETGLRNFVGVRPLGTDLARVLTPLALERRRAARVLFESGDKKTFWESGKLLIVGDKLRGALFGADLSKEEEEWLSSCRAVFLEERPEEKKFLRALAVLSLYLQPFELPLRPDAASFSAATFESYLFFALRQPHLMRESDEALYLSYYEAMTAWILSLLQGAGEGLARIVQDRLTFGACLYIDAPNEALLENRARILEVLAARFPGENAVFPPRVRRRIRLGILSRNLGDYTDTRALYALFHAFDPEKYEIYWYSLDIQDLSVRENAVFSKKLSALIHKAVSLKGDALARAAQILADDLDIFVLGTAYAFGAKATDQMLALRLARVQVSLAALFPLSPRLSSFDVLIAPEGTDEKKIAEEVRELEGPVLWYERPQRVSPDAALSRGALGIPADAVLYASGAAANKLMAGTLRCWLSVLREVPGSFLLLCPFNPAWGGVFLALTLFARLRSVMKDFPDVDPGRIVVMPPVSPENFERLVQLCDVHFGSFPRDGATVAMQALFYGRPVVARREGGLHAVNDALLLRSIGRDDLIGKDAQDFKKIAVTLGLDPALRAACAAAIEASLPQAPFFDAANRSRKLQEIFDEIAVKKGFRY